MGFNSIDKNDKIDEAYKKHLVESTGEQELAKIEKAVMASLKGLGQFKKYNTKTLKEDRREMLDSIENFFGNLAFELKGQG